MQFYLSGIEISEALATDMVAREISAHGYDIACVNRLFAAAHRGNQNAADDLAMYVPGLEIITADCYLAVPVVSDTDNPIN
jgi:hypothetical protein